MAPAVRAVPSVAARHGGEGDAAAARLLAGHPAAAHGNDPVGQGTESCGSCEESSTVAPSDTASPISCPSSAAEAASRPACGSSSSQSAGRRAERRPGRPGAAARPRAARRRRAQAPGQSDPLERLVGARGGQPEGADGEPDVLRRAEVVVERGGMAQEADVAAHRRVVRGQIDPEDRRLARGHRQQPSTGPQQAGLARAVGAHDHDDLALVEREIDPGEGGEAAGERDRGTEVDDRGHGLRHHGRGGGSRGSKRAPGPGHADDQTQT